VTIANDRSSEPLPFDDPHSSYDSDVPRSAYIHIPFCRRRCFYCDFPISVVGDRPPQAIDEGVETKFGTIAHYTQILCQEIETTPTAGQSLQTIFFGGGTPSLLSVSQLEQILSILDRQFGIAANAEISMEIDPGTFDWWDLQGYRIAGVNRVSLGVQAFQPELLTVCGRSHTVAEVYEAIALIRRAGFPSFSLDLISGLPHQTLEHWQASLEKAIALYPNHISIYDLTIEPMTAFGHHYQPGIAPLPADETTAQMYRLAQKMLTEAGYEHYEISNYAQPGHQCCHNRVYWENRPFYGFGMGATSYLQGDRFARPRKTREYYEWVKTRQQNSPSASPSQADRLLDTLMVGLRLAEGISMTKMAEQFGHTTVQRICDRLHPYQRQGWVEINNTQIRFTDPEGFLFSNVMLTDLFEEFGDP
jgi:putative oxygen-independent coproporphyrinogen III oxidase